MARRALALAAGCCLAASVAAQQDIAWSRGIAARLSVTCSGSGSALSYSVTTPDSPDEGPGETKPWLQSEDGSPRLYCNGRRVADHRARVARRAQRHRPQTRGRRVPHLALGGHLARAISSRFPFVFPSFLLHLLWLIFGAKTRQVPGTTDRSCLGRRVNVGCTHYTAHDALGFSQSFPPGRCCRHRGLPAAALPQL